jgi:hypothetical protein
MSRLDLARIQFGMTLTNRPELVPGSIDLAADSHSDVFWDKSAAAAGADAVSTAPR